MWRGLPLSVLLSRERAAFALVYRKNEKRLMELRLQYDERRCADQYTDQVLSVLVGSADQYNGSGTGSVLR